MPNRYPPIFICGPPVSGKTTLADSLSAHYGIQHHNTGDLLKEFAASQYGFKSGGSDWWETPEGRRFTEMRRKDPNIDKQFDDYVKGLANKGDCVLSSWTMPWLYEGEAVRVWLTASDKVRAERMANRDGIPVDEALKKVLDRDRKNYEVYKAAYGIEFGTDFTPFDIILHTDNLPPEKVVEFAVQMIDKRIRRE